MTVDAAKRRLRGLDAQLVDTLHRHEIDAVVVLPDGRWGAVEVKLGERQVLAGAKSLRTAVDQIESSPSFRLVITGTGGTFTLDDGTITCPLAVLGA